MSLNGLDATDVNEAYLAALGEGGGWYFTPGAPTSEDTRYADDIGFCFTMPVGPRLACSKRVLGGSKS